MLKSITFAALLAVTPTPAQTPLRSLPLDGFKFMSHEAIDKAVSIPEPGSVVGATFMNDHENYYVEFVKRIDRGNLVVTYAHWMEHFTIVSGDGILTYGGTVSDAKESRPGEVRGGTQSGANVQLVHAGDYFQIPPGMAHKLDAAPGKNLSYVVFKVRS
jgi:mannose-6-phosphate isomerase-like protein (cupin superfamily)